MERPSSEALLAAGPSIPAVEAPPCVPTSADRQPSGRTRPHEILALEASSAPLSSRSMTHDEERVAELLGEPLTRRLIDDLLAAIHGAAG